MTPDNKLIFGFDEKIAAWVARQIPHVGDVGFGPCRAVGVAVAGRPVAGIVYHDYQPLHRTVQISMASASPLWAKWNTIRALLAIPFDQYNVYKIWTAIPSDNERALRFNRGIGMKSEGTLRHQFGPKRAAIIFGMTAGEFAAKWRLKEAA
jgi:RimJ/RimL family protein N-acetyltransferase